MSKTWFASHDCAMEHSEQLGLYMVTHKSGAMMVTRDLGRAEMWAAFTFWSVAVKRWMGVNDTQFRHAQARRDEYRDELAT